MKRWCLLTAFGAAALWGAEWERHLRGADAAFVLLNTRTGEFTKHDAARADRRFPPCATFQVPLAAMALETGAAPSPEYRLAYNPAWNLEGEQARPHDLRSAFRYGVEWYQQEMARRIGAPREREYLRRFAYGNAAADSNDPPRISPVEQVLFLQRFHDGKLGLTERTNRLVKSLMSAEAGPGWHLYTVSGACRAGQEEEVQWSVGWVEKGTDVFSFALETGAPNADLYQARAMLDDLGITTPSPGETMLRRSCSACHGLDAIHSRHRTREEWGMELDKMTAMGAKVPNRAALLAYLAREYGK